MWYSAQQDTVFFSATLDANTAYFICVFNFKSKNGGLRLQTPFSAHWTTGSSFPLYSVSGTVQQGTTPWSPANALVVVSSTPLAQQEPNFVMGTVADGSGNFSIPYLWNGAYYPAAAKDVGLDGRIDPQLADAVGFGNPVVVNNDNVTGQNIVFREYGPVSWSDALDSASAYVGQFPPDRQLRLVRSWDNDSLGRSLEDWEFKFISATHPDTVFEIQVNTFVTRTEASTDPGDVYFITTFMTELPPLAGSADPGTFVTNAENSGGREFRNQSKPPR
jgi:hypothetical protein